MKHQQNQDYADLQMLREQYDEALEQIQALSRDLSKYKAEIDRLENDNLDKSNTITLLNSPSSPTKTHYSDVAVQCNLTFIAEKEMATDISENSLMLEMPIGFKKSDDIMLDLYRENRSLREEICLYARKESILKKKYHNLKQQFKYHTMKTKIAQSIDDEDAITNAFQNCKSRKLGAYSTPVLNQIPHAIKSNPVRDLLTKCNTMYHKMQSTIASMKPPTQLFPMDFSYEYTQPFRIMQKNAAKISKHS